MFSFVPLVILYLITKYFNSPSVHLFKKAICMSDDIEYIFLTSVYIKFLNNISTKQ